MNTYLQVLQKYAVFGGRATRKEYWMFLLFNVLIFLGLAVFVGGVKALTHIDLAFIGGLYYLAVICPGLAVSVRRLHDTNRSGWMVLIGAIPFIGHIIVIVLMCLDGTPGDNNFGRNPKAVTMNVW